MGPVNSQIWGPFAQLFTRYEVFLSVPKRISSLRFRATPNTSRGTSAQLRSNEFVDFAVQYSIDVSFLYFRPMVFDQLVGSEHVGTDLGAETDLHLLAPQLGQLLEALLLGPLGEACGKDRKSTL